MVGTLEGLNQMAVIKNLQREFDPIEYLVNKKYPWGYKTQEVIKAKKASGAHSKFSIEESNKSLQPIEEYRKQLIDLKNNHSQEFELLLETEKSKDREEARLKFEREEKGRFYNQPSANMNINYWGKLDYWSLDESVALSFGKNPKYVNWKKIEPLLPHNVFAQKYEQLREMCLRARDGGILYDKMYPQTFVQWIKQKNISFPDELEKLVLESQIKSIDWKKEYKKLEEIYEKNKITSEQEISLLQNKIKAQETEILGLQQQLSQISEANNNSNNIISSNESQTKRKLNNVLKILYYLIKKRLAYDPLNPRATATKIYNFLWEEEGVKIVTIDVIAGYLKEIFEKIQDNEANFPQKN